MRPWKTVYGSQPMLSWYVVLWFITAICTYLCHIDFLSPFEIFNAVLIEAWVLLRMPIVAHVLWLRVWFFCLVSWFSLVLLLLWTAILCLKLLCWEGRRVSSWRQWFIFPLFVPSCFELGMRKGNVRIHLSSWWCVDTLLSLVSWAVYQSRVCLLVPLRSLWGWSFLGVFGVCWSSCYPSFDVFG